MGIINVNDDSFSNDGSLEMDEIGRQVINQLSSGADIIDVGAESARTNREAISIDEEIRRFKDFMKKWEHWISEAKPRDDQQLWPPFLSLNTWRSEVIEHILPLGGDLLNDMSALPSSKNAELAAKHQVAMIIMHSVGEPKVAHTHVQWRDIIEELKQFFCEKIQLAGSVGLSQEFLMLDPGIDFAKQKEANLEIYHRLAEITKEFCCPLLLPVSRKTVIGDVLGLRDPTTRDAGTVACVVQGCLAGAQCFRVHDVAAVYEAIRMVDALEVSQAETP